MMIETDGPSGDEISSQLFRMDALVGCSNLLGFSEMLAKNFGGKAQIPMSIMSLDVNNFSVLNANHGHEQGDAVLRWIGLVLKEETQAPAYRIAGDEFVVTLLEGSHTEHAALAMRVFDRLNNQAELFGLQVPAAAIAVIHYTGKEKLAASNVLFQVNSTVYEVKKHFGKTIKFFRADQLDTIVDQQSLHWITNLMMKRIVSLGAMLDESNHLAYTDPVTGLPNLRAAQHHIQKAIAQAAAEGRPLSILLIDGDDLRRYNQISYAAGDEMIQRLGETLKDQLRPGDFLARWRVGDEFLVLLPATPVHTAIAVGERLCRSVETASQKWVLSVTISIGVAGYPEHGETENALMQEAEAANDRAKSLGKNRVVSNPAG